MSKSNACESGLLTLLFNNTDFANVGDAGGLQNSAAAGSFGVSLHTADPGEAGSQTTSEVALAAYGNYVRQTVARSGAGWTISGTAPTQVANAAQVQFPSSSGGTGATASHFGIGTDLTTGAGTLLYSGELLGPGVVVAPANATEVLAATAHGFTLNQGVRIRVTDGVLPTGLSAATLYYVVTVNANDFQVSLTQSGAAVTFSTDGTGTIKVHLDKYIAISNNIAPTFALGALVCTED